MYKNFTVCSEKLSDIQAIDFFLAKRLMSLLDTEHMSSGERYCVFHLFIAVSHALNDGHTCLALSTIAEKTCWNAEEQTEDGLVLREGFTFPSLPIINSMLARLPLLEDNASPVLLEYNRLYLRRYWQFECEVTSKLKPMMSKTYDVDIKHCHSVLSTLFNSPSFESIDMQKVAVANALNKQFSVIAGGPGTGKTTTVTKLLMALLMLNEQGLKILMAAPTGKAAQRLTESITDTVERIKTQCAIPQAVVDNIPSDASTIHRLLGVKRNDHNFKHNDENLLDVDVLLIDEISMVDLPLMARLLRALPAHARLILLGDADQLPSVAAGSILADIAPRERLGFTLDNSRYIHDITGYDFEEKPDGLDHLALLTYSHRFKGNGGIGVLANAVINGDKEAALKVLNSQNPELTYAKDEEIVAWLAPLVNQYYLPLFSATDIAVGFGILESFRILAANRRGERGVDNINAITESLLKKRGVIKGQETLYHGKPIMVTTNDYALGLYNGDIGLIWQINGKLVAAFPTTDEHGDTAYRFVSPARLPSYDSVFAMTVHKTQGSEFKNIALILPEQDNPILSRELLYTGATRAKQHINLLVGPVVLSRTIEKRIVRHSALKKRLFDIGA